MEIAPVLQTASSNPIQIVKNSADTLPFRRGDVIEALVTEKLGNHEVLLVTKSSTFQAQSTLSLNVGDRLNLQVEETQPVMLLKLITPDKAEAVQIQDSLAMFRSSPEGILNVVKNGLEIFHAGLQPLDRFVDEKDIDSLLKILHSLIYSEKSLTNPLFLKEFISNIGYMMEKDLKKALERSQEKGDRLPCESNRNFKSLLIKLSFRLHQMIDEAASSDLDPILLDSWKSLSHYVDDSLNTISNQQMINVIGQEENRIYYFQFPFKFGDDLRKADLFIKLDGEKGKKNGKNEKYEFVLFLNIDPLGDLMVDVKCHQKKIWGLFKCERAESRDFLSAFLETLNGRLIDAGYGPNSFNVRLSANLSEEKFHFKKDIVIYSKQAINCFA